MRPENLEKALRTLKRERYPTLLKSQFDPDKNLPFLSPNTLKTSRFTNITLAASRSSCPNRKEK